MACAWFFWRCAWFCRLRFAEQPLEDDGGRCGGRGRGGGGRCGGVARRCGGGARRGLQGLWPIS